MLLLQPFEHLLRPHILYHPPHFLVLQVLEHRSSSSRIMDNVWQLYRLRGAALVLFEQAYAVYGWVHRAQVPAGWGYQDGREGLLEWINHYIPAAFLYILMLRSLIQR